MCVYIAMCTAHARFIFEGNVFMINLTNCAIATVAVYSI